MSSSDEKTNGTSVNGSDRDVEKAAVEAPMPEPGPTLNKTPSKADSVALEREVVPQSERRGLLGRFSIIPEVTNPYSYSAGTKWWMTVIVSFAAITSSTGSSIFYRENPMKANVSETAAFV